MDALPYCRAQCCALRDTCVTPEEQQYANYDAYFDPAINQMVLKRDADGFCYALNIIDRPKLATFMMFVPKLAETFTVRGGILFD